MQDSSGLMRYKCLKSIRNINLFGLNKLIGIEIKGDLLAEWGESRFSFDGYLIATRARVQSKFPNFTLMARNEGRRCAGKGLSSPLGANEVKEPIGDCIKRLRRSWIKLCFV